MKNILAILSAAIILASCGGVANKEDQLKTKKEEFEKLRNEIAQLELDIAKDKGGNTTTGKPVKLQTLALVTFEHSIDIQAKVDAEESVSVGPQIPGLVKRVHVHAGDKVSAGQILAEVDADAMIQQLAAIKLQRDLAKDVHERQ